MLAARGAGQDFQARELALHRVNDLQRLRFVVDGQHQKLRMPGARCLEQIEPGSVAVKRFHPITSQRFDLVGIMIEDGGAKAISAKNAADNVSETAETGENDRIIVLIDFVRGTLGLARLK